LGGILAKNANPISIIINSNMDITAYFIEGTPGGTNEKFTLYLILGGAGALSVDIGVSLRIFRKKTIKTKNPVTAQNSN
jgi:hypothetical protein